MISYIYIYTVYTVYIAAMLSQLKKEHLSLCPEIWIAQLEAWQSGGQEHHQTYSHQKTMQPMYQVPRCLGNSVPQHLLSAATSSGCLVIDVHLLQDGGTVIGDGHILVIFNSWVGGECFSEIGVRQRCTNIAYKNVKVYMMSCNV